MKTIVNRKSLQIAGAVLGVAFALSAQAGPDKPLYGQHIESYAAPDAQVNYLNQPSGTEKYQSARRLQALDLTVTFAELGHVDAIRNKKRRTDRI